MDSDDEISPDPPLPDIPVQSRTLLHYFSKVNGQLADKKSSSQIDEKTKLSEKSSKRSLKKSLKYVSSENSVPNEIESIVQEDLTLVKKHIKHKRKPKNYEGDEDIENVPASKKIRAAIDSCDSETKNQKDALTEEKSVKRINSFFTKVSKDEYQKECKKQIEQVKLTVTAMVHTPEIIAKIDKNEIESKQEILNKSNYNTPNEKQAGKLRKRKCSFTNVVRPISETDTIKVIEQENVLHSLTQNCDTELNVGIQKIKSVTEKTVKICPENSISSIAIVENLKSHINKPDKNQNKVSDKLFKRKNRKTISSLDLDNVKNKKVSKTPDDSVDVDFFNMQMGIPNEEENDDKENIVKELTCETRNPASPDSIDFQPSPKKVHKIGIQHSLSSKKSEKIAIDSDRIKDDKTVEVKARNESNFVEETKSENRNVEYKCISDSVGNDKGQNLVEPELDKTPKKTPTPVSLFKHKDPPKKKYTRKTKGADKTNAVNGIAHVNYDSDSIDLDLLATYNAKTFHSAASGEAVSNTGALDSSNDETNNVFSALLKKPLTKRKTSPSTSPNAISNNLSISNGVKNVEPFKSCISSNRYDKEDKIKNDCDKKSAVDSPKTPNIHNAFEKLMSSKKSKNSNCNTIEKETLASSELGQNDSLKDFVCDSSDIQHIEFLSSKSSSFLSMEKGSNGEYSSPQPVEIKNVADNSSCSQRRCSSRIQRNIEIAEAKKRDMVIAEINSEVKKSKFRRGAEKSLISEDKSANECSLKSPQIITQKSQEAEEKANRASTIGISTAKYKPTAAIFLVGRKKENLNRAPTVEEDSEKQAARKAFLLSSVPQSLKNQVDLSRKESLFLKPTQEYFSSIGHITQISSSDTLLQLNKNSRTPRKNIYRETEESVQICDYIITPKSVVLYSNNSKHKNTKKLENKELRVTDKYRNFRLTVLQIYNYARAMKLKDYNQSQTSQHNQILATNTQNQNSNIKQYQAFPVNKIFRRYLERKLEADSIELEARKKNISLTELEEERLSSCRKLRRKVREHNNGKMKLAKSKKMESKEKNNLKNENCNTNSNVTYDPESQCSMLWTIKHAPKSIDDVIGNANVVKKLQKWLGEWEARDIERKKKRRQCRNVQSDSSDAYSDESEMSSDDERMLQNTALLVGPNGVGKTATVYALAHEMGFKVLELNASSTRSGRQVLANLREATQSHSVKQEKSKEDSKPGLELKKTKANTIYNSNETKSIDKTTVILFEDIDIVFEDLDEGFHSAINSLISTTKRPIVLTTSSQNFMACNKNKILNIKCLPQIFEFRPIQPRIIARYLQLLCLVEGFYMGYESLLGLIMLNKGNISASMHQLQYWVTIYGSNHKEIDYNVLGNNVKKAECYSVNEEIVEKSRSIEREDSLAKLMSITQLKPNLGSATFSLLNCSLSPIGLKFDNSTTNSSISLNAKHEHFLSTKEVMSNLLSVDSFHIFDWSRHILLPFHRIKSQNRKARTTHYPLTAKNNIENSTSFLERLGSDMSGSNYSRDTYRRIKNNDSLFMTESEDDTTADEGEVLNDEVDKDKVDIQSEENLLETNDCEMKIIHDNCTNNCSKSSDRPFIENQIPKDEESRKNKANSFRNAKKAMEILSDYTNTISEFFPLQDDQSFYLRTNHKNLNCSSQLCSNSNFYESFMKTNNFQLLKSYSSHTVDQSHRHEQNLAQDIIANVAYLSLNTTQNSIQNLLSTETTLFELSVHRPFDQNDQKNDKLPENLYAEPIDEEDRDKEAERKQSLKHESITRDLICETAINKDFERGFDDSYIKQLHNAEREVLQSFFPDPNVNVSRHYVQDALPVIRGMARMEEHRKASGLGYSKKRHSRSKFLHYFETQNLYIVRSPTVLNTLCNSFQSV